MRAFLSFFAKGIMVAFVFSCHNSTVAPTAPGTWDKLSDFAGPSRKSAVGFVIDDIAYVGTGFSFAQSQSLTDFWSYNKASDSWTKLPDFPGSPRNSAVAFTLNGKGYVGLGFDVTNIFSDFYQYDPTQNKWTRIADFGTSPTVTLAQPRLGAIGFNVGGKAFVGTGIGNTENYLQDFWQYDDVQNQWSKITDIGAPRVNGWAMVIGSFAYIGGGSNKGVILSDVWKFDPSSSNPWVNLEIKGSQPPSRQSATTFSIGDYGYLSSGTSMTGALQDTWQYNPPPANVWTQVKSSLSVSRQSGVGFAIGDAGYITTGGTGNICFDDCWVFKQ